MKHQLKQALLILIIVLSGNTVTAQLSTSPSALKLNLAYSAINNLYVDSVSEDKQVEAAIKAMVAQLDPHSAYMTAEEMKDLNEPLQGGFDGIGISFNMLNDTLIVIEVISGGPSEKVGLLPGDRIIKVEGETIAGVKMSNNEVMKRLKGPKGTTVNLQIKRKNNNSFIPFRIIRDKIPIYSIESSFLLNDHTGYIRLSRFGATTKQEFKDAVAELKHNGMNELILDLQSNGGGLMNAAIDMADEFLSDGKCIVYTKGLHLPRTQSDATKNGVFEKGNLIILMDEYSASSSEILAGAIQDWDRGLIVGRRSFGKGLVQRPIRLPDGSSLKLTIARYYTPSGRFIQKPYDEGSKKYRQDLIDRFDKGEMIHPDSIHFVDSLKTSTLINHRVIYGGGGIMPDVFVPYDSAKYNKVFQKLASTGIINRFCLEYVDANRRFLKENYKTSDDFIEKFMVSDAMVNNLINMAVKDDSTTISDSDKQADMRLLKLQIKAYITRDLWKSSDFDKVMWTENEALLKALEILNDKKRYNTLLEGK
jgi:carboxyl-terminal processing protease